MADWSVDMCLLLIDHYERQTVLWDPKHPFYYSKNKKINAWQAIARSLNLDVKTVRQKMVSLLGSFRAQKSKGKKAVGTGADRKDTYVSKWFAFERMQFLLDKDPRSNISTETGNSDLTNESAPLSPLSDEYYHEPTSMLEMTHNDSNAMIFKNEPSNLTTGETTDNCISQENSQLERKTDVSPPVMPHKKMRNSQNGHVHDHAIDVRDELQDTPTRYVAASSQYVPLVQDRFATYGEHVANKLRTYNQRTQAIVEHAINNILFEADMGNYEKIQSDDPAIYKHCLKCSVVSSSTTSCSKS